MSVWESWNLSYNSYMCERYTVIYGIYFPLFNIFDYTTYNSEIRMEIVDKKKCLDFW